MLFASNIKCQKTVQKATDSKLAVVVLGGWD